MMCFNMEGYTRNKYFLQNTIDTYDNILFVFVQEHWLSTSESSIKFHQDFPSFKFLTTSSDMFNQPEDLLFSAGPIWH